MEWIAACVPDSPGGEIPWSRIRRLFAGLRFPDLKATMQNPEYHGEGDADAHTQMVCRELTEDPSFYELPDRQRTELFLAGSRMVRTFLWRDCGICGSRELITFRETVCALVRWHMLPVHLMNQEEPKRKVHEVAAVGELAEDFSWHLLCMLAKADGKGRIADDREEYLGRVELSRMMAEEAGALYAPYPFPDSCTKHAYLSGRNVRPDQMLYDPAWGEVIMLSGLPGTGKDTWIRRHHANLPMISLDGLRAELEIRPTDRQGEVIQAARERAKGYLRDRQPFIWNATDLTKDIRKQLTGLFERYGARVRIVYLETAQQTRKARNAERYDAVPEEAVAGMLGKTVLPTPEEAQTVEWLCV